MADEFKPIETQDAFDAAIKSRLERHTKTVADEVAKKFEGYISPDDLEKKTSELNSRITKLSEQLKAKDTEIATANAKCTAYECDSIKQRVAHEYGIPYELASKLSGSDEKEIKADAEKLAKFVSKSQASPKYSGEKKEPDSSKAALMSMLQDLKK